MTAETHDRRAIAAHDSGIGTGMFVIFSVAILIVTGAVARFAISTAMV